MGRERTKGRKLLKKLDELYFRARDAWRVLTDRNYLPDARHEARQAGEWILSGRVMRALDEADPHEFSNNHFKLGYYYAYETVKKVTHGNDNPME